jgi:ABC-2 type transport system permease protein
MKKTWIVFKTEFINTLTRRSFLLTLILVPLVPALILGGVALFGDDGDDGQGMGIFQPPQPESLTEGMVDRAGIITTLPDWVSEERLIAYSSEEAARQAALAGEISGYYVIQKDFIQTGAVHYNREDFNPLSALDSTEIMQEVIEFNLLGADPQRYRLFEEPVQIEQIDLDPEEVDRDEDNILAFYVPYGVTMLFYVLILTSASLMLNSVAKEKENRVMEILVSSIKPNQLLVGKILGLGLVGLLQMVFWMGSGLILLHLGGDTLNIPLSLQLSPEIFLWGIPFFILGYLLYATIMAGAGALVPNVKESTQATFIVILPILVPLIMIGVIINQPDAPLPVILSLIPFTAPNTIMTRMAVTSVPVWQLLLSMALLGITIFFLIRAVTKMFRAQLLLTGKKFNLGLYIKALSGKKLEASDLSDG